MILELFNFNILKQCNLLPSLSPMSVTVIPGRTPLPSLIGTMKQCGP